MSILSPLNFLGTASGVLDASKAWDFYRQGKYSNSLDHAVNAIIYSSVFALFLIISSCSFTEPSNQKSSPLASYLPKNLSNITSSQNGQQFFFDNAPYILEALVTAAFMSDFSWKGLSLPKNTVSNFEKVSRITFSPKVKVSYFAKGEEFFKLYRTRKLAETVGAVLGGNRWIRLK